jgi:hypothetical protein
VTSLHETWTVSARIEHSQPPTALVTNTRCKHFVDAALSEHRLTWVAAQCSFLAMLRGHVGALSPKGARHPLASAPHVNDLLWTDYAVGVARGIVGIRDDSPSQRIAMPSFAVREVIAI